MKAYTLGSNGFVRSAVLQAIGEPTRRRQASVLVVAPSKARGVEVAKERGLTVRAADSEYRQVMGPRVDAFVAAGLLNAEGVLVTPLNGWSDVPVVRLLVGGVPQRIGRLVRDGESGHRLRFEHEEGN